jgi:PhzF family phenazine biosynthesis protein
MGVSGHATIAAVTVGFDCGLFKDRRLFVETINGTFAVACAPEGNGTWRITLAQRVPEFGACVPASEVQGALDIRRDDITEEEGPIRCVSVSRPKLLVPLRNSNILNSLLPRFDLLWALCEKYAVSGLYPFTRNTNKPWAYAESRQYPLRAGFLEDAATGVAAAALGAYIARYDFQYASGKLMLGIAQGYAMRAPSRIDAIVYCDGSSVTQTAVSGFAQIKGKEEVPCQLS